MSTFIFKHARFLWLALSALSCANALALPIAKNKCALHLYTLDEISAYQTLNAQMARKYPELDTILKDPKAFYDEMSGRFIKQKKITPETPYQFDYSEIGMPLIREMETDLAQKIDALKTIKDRLKGSGLFTKYRAEELDTGLKYLGDLLTENAEYVRRGSITYQELYEFSYFFSRAIGHFDTREYDVLTRFALQIDRFIDGYKQLHIEKEYALYRNRAFSVFQTKSLSPGFQATSKAFQEGFHNPDELEVLIVPTKLALDRDVLMRLMPYHIEIIGVTNIPILADGFWRPGGDFWMHDIRHSGAKFFEFKRYVEKNGLTEPQVRKLKLGMDKWQGELNRALSLVKDPELRGAIEFYMFNYNHDRGYPLVPSAYQRRTPDGIAFLLYTMMRISKQPVEFKNPVKNIFRAYAWLRKFWRARIGEEMTILQRDTP